MYIFANSLLLLLLQLIFYNLQFYAEEHMSFNQNSYLTCFQWLQVTDPKGH